MSKIVLPAAGLAVLGLALVAPVAPTAAQTQPARPAQPAPAARPAAPPPVVPLPRALAGYAHPDIPASSCRVETQVKTVCTIPAMTAGRYVITASGTSTATADGAGQAVVLIVGGRACGRADRRGTAQSPWASGRKTLTVACDVMILTDRPLEVIVNYADDKATRDPRGPTLKIDRAPWDGVMSAQFYVPPGQ